MAHVHICAREQDDAGAVIQGHMMTSESKYHAACPPLRALAPLVNRRQINSIEGQLGDLDGDISVPGDGPSQKSLPRERVPQRRRCPTKTVGEKRSNSAENVKLPDRKNIHTGTRFGGSNKCPNVSPMRCPPCPRVPASPRWVWHERGSIPDGFPIAKLIRMCSGSTGTRCYSVEVFLRERAY